MLLKLFFNFDVFNHLIHKYRKHPSTVYTLAVIASFVIQTGVFVGPIISTSIPDTWSLGYKVLLGSVVGMFLSAIKDLFTDKERERSLNELREKLQKHNERLSGHDQRLSGHDQRLSGHDEKFVLNDKRHSGHDTKLSILEKEIEYNKPFVYQPYDPLSDDE